MPHGKRVSEARSAVEIAESVKLVRELISIADKQIDRAKTDLGLARVGLAELELELVTLGIGGEP